MSSETKNVYTVRKVGSTYSTQTISKKNVAQARKEGCKIFKTNSERSAWINKNK